jgi:hypothetical protein
MDRVVLVHHLPFGGSEAVKKLLSSSFVPKEQVNLPACGRQAKL